MTSPARGQPDHRLGPQHQVLFARHPYSTRNRPVNAELGRFESSISVQRGFQR